MPKKLTAAALDHLPVGDYHDSILPGLILRIGARRKAWAFRQRVGGEKRRLTLGYFPAMDLSAARDAARAAMDRLERGAPLTPPSPHPRSPDALTLGGLIDRYERLRAIEGGRIKTLGRAMTALRNDLGPWLTTPAAAFSKADLRAARDKIVERGAIIQGNRLLSYLGPVMRWAENEDLVPVNIVRGLRKAPERKRDRALSPPELRAIWRACTEFEQGKDASTVAYGKLVKFLAVTGARRDEAAGMYFRDILDGRWTVPASRAKNGQPIVRLLPPLARDLVGQGEPDQLVFRGVSGQIGGFSKFKKALDQKSGVEGWVHHDFRRTMASALQDLEIRNEVVQALLGHVLQGVAGVYLLSKLQREKDAALQAWADQLKRIVNPRRSPTTTPGRQKTSNADVVP